MRPTQAWKSVDGTTALRRVEIERRELRDDDVAVRIEYCGVCHSDLHRVRGLLGEANTVPGHEFTGTVTAVGPAVTEFAPGDQVAVGTIVDSCGECPMCASGQENYCWEGPVTTYGGKDRVDGTATQGGYSREYVVREKFTFHVPDGLDPVATGPLMCAGISVWEPLLAAGVTTGSRVGVAGLGGLGHLAVKLAVALGADVTVLSRTPTKAQDSKALGATDLLVTTDETQMQQAREHFTLIIDTISAEHDLSPLLRLLALDGTLCVLGNPLQNGPRLFDLIPGRKKLTSSGTGGLRHTAELLEFCATHGISPDIEVLPSTRVQTALERLERGDVRYRFVLDLSDLDATTN